MQVVNIRFPVRQHDDLRLAKLMFDDVLERMGRPVFLEFDFGPLVALDLAQHLPHLR